MAQWSGQFSGNTHLSRVHDVEQQLQHAVDVYRTLEAHTDKQSQKRVVLRFAEKLLNARIRATKGRIAALDPRDKDDRMKAELKIQKMFDGGIAAVLKEFGVSDLAAE